MERALEDDSEESEEGDSDGHSEEDSEESDSGNEEDEESADRDGGEDADSNDDASPATPPRYAPSGVTLRPLESGSEDADELTRQLRQLHLEQQR